jgi:hypothetical protein
MATSKIPEWMIAGYLTKTFGLTKREAEQFARQPWVQDFAAKAYADPKSVPPALKNLGPKDIGALREKASAAGQPLHSIFRSDFLGVHYPGEVQAPLRNPLAAQPQVAQGSAGMPTQSTIFAPHFDPLPASAANPYSLASWAADPPLHRQPYTLGPRDTSNMALDIIAREARPNDVASIDAVIDNVLNRVGGSGFSGKTDSVYNVLTSPEQYEAYKFLQSGRFKPATAEQRALVRERLEAKASGKLPDVTGGATEYRASSYVEGRGKNKTFARRAAAQNAPNIGGNVYTTLPGTEVGPHGASKMLGAPEMVDSAQFAGPSVESFIGPPSTDLMPRDALVANATTGMPSPLGATASARLDPVGSATSAPPPSLASSPSPTMAALQHGAPSLLSQSQPPMLSQPSGPISFPPAPSGFDRIASVPPAFMPSQPPGRALSPIPPQQQLASLSPNLLPQARGNPFAATMPPSPLLGAAGAPSMAGAPPPSSLGGPMAPMTPMIPPVPSLASSGPNMLPPVTVPQTAPGVPPSLQGLVGRSAPPIMSQMPSMSPIPSGALSRGVPAGYGTVTAPNAPQFGSGLGFNPMQAASAPRPPSPPPVPSLGFGQTAAGNPTYNGRTSAALNSRAGIAPTESMKMQSAGAALNRGVRALAEAASRAFSERNASGWITSPQNRANLVPQVRASQRISAPPPMPLRPSPFYPVGYYGY